MKTRTGIEAMKLKTLARKTRDEAQLAVELGLAAQMRLGAAVTEAVLCGTHLNEAKEILGSAAFPDWLSEHCKKVDLGVAQNFMALAKLNIGGELVEGKKFCRALKLIGVLPGAQPMPTVATPATREKLE